jgi:hypothetical protein
MVIKNLDLPNSNNVAILGVVISKPRKIRMKLTEFDSKIAIKAYRDRPPIICFGDLMKTDNTFVLQNPPGLILDCGT